MYRAAANPHVLDSGQSLFSVARAGPLPLVGPQLAGIRWREPASKRSYPSIAAALDPAFPNQQPDFSDFQWPSTSRVGGRQGEVEREVKAGAREKWSKDNESALSGDTPLPLPLAYPGTEPASQKQMDAMLNCDPEVEVCSLPLSLSLSAQPSRPIQHMKSANPSFGKPTGLSSLSIHLGLELPQFDCILIYDAIAGLQGPRVSVDGQVLTVSRHRGGELLPETR